jgi:hypothetical protein
MHVVKFLLVGGVLLTTGAVAQQAQSNKNQQTKTDQQRTDTSPTSQSAKRVNPDKSPAGGGTNPHAGTQSPGSKNPPAGSSIGWDTRQSGNQATSSTKPISGMNGRSSDESKAKTNRYEPQRTANTGGVRPDTRNRNIANNPGAEAPTDGKSPDVKTDPARMRRGSSAGKKPTGH